MNSIQHGEGMSSRAGARRLAALDVLAEIPIRTVSVMNAREHWSVTARRAKQHRESAGWTLMSSQRPKLPCTVVLTRIAPRELDGDNLQSSLKAVRDGVADWLRVDDRDPRVSWRYRQQRGKAREYAVRVEIG